MKPINQIEAYKQKTGNIGEDAATNFLTEKGYKIIERNYKRKLGEIDIIAIIDKTLVFCEVKTRKSYSQMYFLPEQNVDFKKMRKLRKICELYVLEKKISVSQKWRIDVISVLIDNFTEKVTINHIEDAVWEKQY